MNHYKKKWQKDGQSQILVGIITIKNICTVLSHNCEEIILQL